MAQHWKVQRLSLASSQVVSRGIMAGPFRKDMPQDVGYQPEWPLDRAIPDYLAWL
jgi:hypothetical protein